MAWRGLVERGGDGRDLVEFVGILLLLAVSKNAWSFPQNVTTCPIYFLLFQNNLLQVHQSKPNFASTVPTPYCIL